MACGVKGLFCSGALIKASRSDDKSLAPGDAEGEPGVTFHKLLGNRVSGDSTPKTNRHKLTLMNRLENGIVE